MCKFNTSNENSVKSKKFFYRYCILWFWCWTLDLGASHSQLGEQVNDELDVKSSQIWLEKMEEKPIIMIS